MSWTKPVVIMQGGIVQDQLGGDIEYIDFDEVGELEGEALIHYAVTGLYALIPDEAAGWGIQLTEAIERGIGEMKEAT